MHMRVREDFTEARDPNLIELADMLFEGQELYILYLAQTMVQTVSYFPINTTLHLLHLLPGCWC